MKRVTSLIALMIIMISASAQFPSYVRNIEVKSNNIVRVKGNLSQGRPMQDLSWAWKSSVACFPGTQQGKFNGNHVLYSTVIPPKAKMYITVIPDSRNANLSIYAYEIGTNNYQLVPKLSSCVSCEAEHKWDRPKQGQTQDYTRTVVLNAINNPYNVVIGVAGAMKLRNASYTLEIKLEGGTASANAVQNKLIVNPVSSVKGETITVTGDLKNGVFINDLSWASKSSVACFPATQNSKFTGKHVLYSTTIPKYSNMEITVVPKDPSANFSVYAYEVGMDNNSVVPNLPSCITCEAEHKWDRPKKGKTQDHTRTVKLNAINNPYKVIIGVTGANRLEEGEYTLKIKTTGK